METQYTRLSMTPSGVPPVVYMSRYDVGRPIGFVCDEDLDNYTVTLEATRSDGTPITAAITTDGNVGAFETTATMTNKADKYIAQMVVTDGSGNRIASIPIKFVVVPAALDENSEGIEEDAPLYQQYTGTVQTIIASIRADLAAEIIARQNAVSAEATARQNAITAEANARAAAVSAEAAARQSADHTLQSNINAEASTRATQDASLQSQIDQIIAPSGEAPSAAEIQNARIGANGKTYASLGEAIRTQINDSTQNLTYTYTDASHQFDLNAFKDNAMVYLTGNGILNAPAGENNIVVMCSIGSTATNTYEQIVFSLGTGNIYIRRCVNNTWYAWMTCGDTRNTITTQSYYHTDASHPKDLNALDPNTFWYIGGTNIQNSPVSNGALFVFTMDNSVSGGNTVYSQIVYSFDYGTIYVRRKLNTNWSTWKSNLTEKEFHVGTGQEYTSVTQAVLDATNYKNRTGVIPTVVIHEGEYDLITEGAQGLNDGYGLVPNVNIKGIGNVRLYATLSTSSDVFSIFTPGYADITIENLTLEITNCRYCIHDEAGVNEGVTNRAYHHRYKNLKCINHGWTSGTDRWKRCIGIGLSGNGRIDIEDCAFETAYSDTSAIDAHSSWSYHQENGAVVKVHGCYIPTGGVSATSMGDATDYVNEMYVYDNLLPSNPSINDTKNMRLYAWGNTIS